ncbi:MAG: hypothetical protein AB7O26_00050 [Planctomycetaceae bacterium]
MTDAPLTTYQSGRIGEPAEPRTVVVFERRPRWFPEMQRQFVGEETRIRWCTELRDVERHLAADGSFVVVLDFDECPGECLQLLGRSVGASQSVPFVCIGSQQTAELEWIVRELGGLAFFPDHVTGDRIAALCRRQWT